MEVKLTEEKAEKIYFEYATASEKQAYELSFIKRTKKKIQDKKLKLEKK